jgi:hypothetical protein
MTDTGLFTTGAGASHSDGVCGEVARRPPARLSVIRAATTRSLMRFYQEMHLRGRRQLAMPGSLLERRAHATAGLWAPKTYATWADALRGADRFRPVSSG